MAIGEEVNGLAERAEAAWAQGNANEALQLSLAQLSAEARCDLAWYRAALLLGRMGETATAVDSLDLVSQRFAHKGELLLALAAAQDLIDLEGEVGKRRLHEIARLYAVSSPRLTHKHRPPPLPTPSAPQKAEEVVLEASSDPRVLRELAQDVCLKVAQEVREGSAQAGSKEDPLPYHPLLSDLDVEDFMALTRLMRQRIVPGGEVIIEQGKEGTSFFMIIHGVAQVSQRDANGEQVQLAMLRSGAFFGEMALLTDSPRIAQVTAEPPALHLFEIDRAGVADLAARNPKIANVLAAYTRKRLLKNLLFTSALFRPLDAQRREELIKLFDSRVYEAGDVVLTEGQESDCLYVVLSGNLSVVKQEADGEVVLADIGPGEFIGEISLIQRRPVTATVKVTTKSVLLSLTRSAFNKHISAFPEVLAQVYQVAVEREETNLQLQHSQELVIDESELLL